MLNACKLPKYCTNYHIEYSTRGKEVTCSWYPMQRYPTWVRKIIYYLLCKLFGITEKMFDCELHILGNKAIQVTARYSVDEQSSKKKEA